MNPNFSGVNMDLQHLDVLEDKIKKLLSAMKHLKSENEHLLRKNDEQEKAVQKLRMDLERWSSSADENNHLQEQISALRRERDEVKEKIERLISHLEELEAKI
jgi:predicted RNase H-like nuclease (RuvC/YqgF family)